MIRDYGDSVEASLAYLPSGIDSRDLYRPGGGPSRMTPRRLYVLLKGLPADAPLWREMAEAEERAKIPTAEQIRARQEHYARKARPDQ